MVLVLQQCVTRLGAVEAATKVILLQKAHRSAMRKVGKSCHHHHVAHSAREVTTAAGMTMKQIQQPSHHH